MRYKKMAIAASAAAGALLSGGIAIAAAQGGGTGAVPHLTSGPTFVNTTEAVHSSATTEVPASSEAGTGTSVTTATTLAAGLGQTAVEAHGPDEVTEQVDDGRDDQHEAANVHGEDHSDSEQEDSAEHDDGHAHEKDSGVDTSLAGGHEVDD